VHYRLADPEVFELSKVIRSVAERRLAELERLVNEHFGNRADAEPVPLDELLKRARSKQIVILDTRPAEEYLAGHIPGALSIPVDDLQRRLKELTKNREYVAYCRGPYCIYADRAVEILRANGRRARRLVEGFPDWRAAGFPVSQGSQPGTLTSAR
jgi:rhodanese-related sulfurtransferase